MKKILTYLTLLLAAGVAQAALPKPDLIAQIHFAGVKKISADKNFNSFTNVFCSPEAVALRAQTADKLARVLDGWLKANAGSTVQNGAALLRPLLDDLQVVEWIFEARMGANGKPDLSLMVLLDDKKSQAWKQTLTPFLSASPNPCTMSAGGGWFRLNCGAPERFAGMMAAMVVKADGSWLEADLNWPRLTQWFTGLKGLGLPETQFRVAPRVAPQQVDLRIEGNLFFPENLKAALKPWNMPTNLIHQPFVSFTAVRGLDVWLAGQKWADTLRLTPGLDQFFIWAYPQVPYQTFIASPVVSADSALEQLFKQFEPVMASSNVQKQFMAPVTMSMTTNRIEWKGMPFIAPFLQKSKVAAGQYLFAGVFPNTPKGKPLPPELFERLDQKGLVLYHWEITAERWPTALQLSQLGLMLTSRKQLAPESAAFKWVQKVTPTLGNTVTEIKQVGPGEMTFVRSAPGGLTAAEFLLLAHWLEGSAFPGLDFSPIIRPKGPIKRPPGARPIPAMPAPGMMPAPAPAPR